MPASRSSDRAGRFGTAAALIIGFALLLRAPGLFSAPHAEDYVQLAMLEGEFPAPRSAFALYDFGGRDAADRARLHRHGWFPWWSAPDLKLALFRPLSSALIAADHAIAPGSSRFRHAHSALWLVLLLAAVAALLRAVLPVGLALIGLALVATDPSLSIPLSWAADRASLIAGTFGVCGCHAYLRVRCGDLRPGGALAAGACFALAVLASETGWAFTAVPVALECIATRTPIGVRVRALGMALAPPAAVLALGSGLGFGVSGSGVYVGPLSDPMRYLAGTRERVPSLAADLVWGLPAGDVTFPDDLQRVLGLLGLGALAVGARSIWPVMSRELRALLIGSVLALVLVAGAPAETRLLIASAVGLAAALAFGLGRVLPATTATASRRRRVLSWILLSLLCAVLAIKGARAMAGAAEFAARTAAYRSWTPRVTFDDRAPAKQRWFVIAAKDFTSLSLLPFLRRLDGRAMPEAYHVLSAAPHAHELRRLDDHTIELAVLGRRVDDRFAGSLFRPRSLPLSPGDVFDATHMRVRVLSTVRGNPVRARFRFERPIDDASHVFLHAATNGLFRITVPKLGFGMRLPEPRGPRLRRRLGL